VWYDVWLGGAVISIEKLLPGELDGNVDPEAFGFDVIREDPPSEDEAARRVGRFYARTKELTGVVIPKLEPYLTAISRNDRAIDVAEEAQLD
jgi:hypothetical protein